MAWADMTPTAKTKGSSSSTTTSYATSSVTPNANKLQLIAVASRIAGGTPPAAPTGLSGAGLTWVKIDERTVVGASNSYRLSVWRALGGSPTPGAVTISFASNQTGCWWVWMEVDGTATSGTNGSGAISSDTVGGAGTGVSVTLNGPALADANQRYVGFFWHEAASNTKPSGQFADEVNDQTGSTGGLQSQFGLARKMIAEWSGSHPNMAIVILLNPASNYGSGPTDAPEFVLYFSPSQPTADVKTWVNISDDVRGIAGTAIGRAPRSYESFSAGTQSWILDDPDSRYRPRNTLSPHYPNFKKKRRMRAFLVWKGVAYPIGNGRIDRITPTREGDYSEIQIDCSDTFEQFAGRDIVTGQSSYNGSHLDLNSKYRSHWAAATQGYTEQDHYANPATIGPSLGQI